MEYDMLSRINPKAKEVLDKYSGPGKCRPVFGVPLTEDRLPDYTVFDIPERVHTEHGGKSKSWWLYAKHYGGEDLDALDENYLVPWRLALPVPIFTTPVRQTQIPDKVLGTRTGYVCDVYYNGGVIYSADGHVEENMYPKPWKVVEHLLPKLFDHEFNCLNPWANNGRKVLWIGLPATIRVNDLKPWLVDLVPDTTETSEEEWWAILEVKLQKYGDRGYPRMDLRSDNLVIYRNNGYVGQLDIYRQDSDIMWLDSRKK